MYLPAVAMLLLLMMMMMMMLLRVRAAPSGFRPQKQSLPKRTVWTGCHFSRKQNFLVGRRHCTPTKGRFYCQGERGEGKGSAQQSCSRMQKQEHHLTYMYSVLEVVWQSMAGDYEDVVLNALHELSLHAYVHIEVEQDRTRSRVTMRMRKASACPKPKPHALFCPTPARSGGGSTL